MTNGRASIIVLCCLIVAASSHAATLTGTEATATSPSPVVVTINLASASGEAVAGIQFELAFDPQALTLQGLEAGAAATAAGKLLSTNAVGPGRHRVIIAGLNQTAIADGAILNASLSAPGNTPAGRYDIAIENAVLSDPAGRRVAVTASPGVVIVGDGGEPPPPPPPAGGCGCTTATTAGFTLPGYALTAALALFALSATIARGRSNTRRHW